MRSNTPNPHDQAAIQTAGAPPQAAEAAVVLLHGRGSTAGNMLRLIDEFLHHGVMYLAPQAANRSWYPYSVDAPLESNEPWLSSATDCVSSALEVAGDAGIEPSKVCVVGFSQGGCLASEFVARNPRRYGGLVVLSGSLLGPIPNREFEGSVQETRVFFGCSADDPYVEAERIRESATVFEKLGGAVSHTLYEGLGHAINDDEIRLLNQFIGHLV